MMGIAKANPDLDEIMRRFGYRPDESAGERWAIYCDHIMIVIHPSRAPRLYCLGNKGSHTELSMGTDRKHLTINVISRYGTDRVSCALCPVTPQQCKLGVNANGPRMKGEASNQRFDT